MSFNNSLFLYFIPLLIIPLILAFFLWNNRKSIPFPSNQLLSDLIRKNLAQRKMVLRLKHFLRALIILCAVMAFAAPFFGGPDSSKNYCLVVDNFITMSRFDIQKTIQLLRKNYQIRQVYFGNNLMREGQLAWSYEPQDIGAVISTAARQGKTDRIIVLSDWNINSFSSPFRYHPGIRELLLIQMKDTAPLKNAYVADFSVYPQAAVPSVKMDFNIRFGGNASNCKATVFVNDKIIYTGEAKNSLAFSRFPESSQIKNGLNFGKILLEGDDYTNDNLFYFALIGTGKPMIYKDIDSEALNRTIQTLFPSHFMTAQKKFADILFTSSMDEDWGKKALFLFCENKKSMEHLLRRDFSVYPEFINQYYEGGLISSNAIFSLFRDVRIKYNMVLHHENRLKVETSITAESSDPVATPMPLYYYDGNKTVFPYSLVENEEYFNQSALLPVMISVALSRYYQMNYFLSVEEATQAVFSVKPSLPGFYRDKLTGKYLLKNNRSRSFEFLNSHDIRKYFISIPQDRLTILDNKDLQAFKTFNLALPLMLLILALVMAETVVSKIR